MVQQFLDGSVVLGHAMLLDHGYAWDTVDNGDNGDDCDDDNDDDDDGGDDGDDGDNNNDDDDNNDTIKKVKSGLKQQKQLYFKKLISIILD